MAIFSTDPIRTIRPYLVNTVFNSSYAPIEFNKPSNAGFSPCPDLTAEHHFSERTAASASRFFTSVSRSPGISIALTFSGWTEIPGNCLYTSARNFVSSATLTVALVVGRILKKKLWPERCPAIKSIFKTPPFSVVKTHSFTLPTRSSEVQREHKQIRYVKTMKKFFILVAKTRLRSLGAEWSNHPHQL